MKVGGSVLKQRVFELLKTDDFETILETLYQFPPRQVVNPLISFFYHKDQQIKWAAVTVIGSVVSKLAEKDIESARIVMRRLIWNLNDESGGIGWGSPEAMGEILACNEALANEYTHILISYTREDGNYLEHEMLQRGLMWGIGRLAQVRPHLLKDSYTYFLPYLESSDAIVRGHAVWIMGLLGIREALPVLEHLKEDTNEIMIYLDQKLVKRKTKALAVEAYNAICML